MAQQLPFQLPNRRGQFIGSTGNLFIGQIAADVYLQNAFGNVYPQLRIATFCLGWGMNIITIQGNLGPEGGPLANQWFFQQMPIIANNQILGIRDLGIQPFLPLTYPLFAQALQQQAQALNLMQVAVYQVNGRMITGLHCPWHHKVQVYSLLADQHHELHYHQHNERQGHGEAPGLKVDGAYKRFHLLEYTTQVSNCRRAIGIRE